MYYCHHDREGEDQSGEYVLFKHFDDLSKERDVLKEKNAALSDQLAKAWEDRNRLWKTLNAIRNLTRALGESGEEE